MLKDLVKLADSLDRSGFSREANVVDGLLKKLSGRGAEPMGLGIEEISSERGLGHYDYPASQYEEPSEGSGFFSPGEWRGPMRDPETELYEPSYEYHSMPLQQRLQDPYYLKRLVKQMENIDLSSLSQKQLEQLDSIISAAKAKGVLGGSSLSTKANLVKRLLKKFATTSTPENINLSNLSDGDMEELRYLIGEIERTKRSGGRYGEDIGEKIGDLQRRFYQLCGKKRYNEDEADSIYDVLQKDIKMRFKMEEEAERRAASWAGWEAERRGERGADWYYDD